mmetsp:Transcript_24988/g.25202  ORF Transcript_24988/g.25202 Transcript_24988/m.25202 type:complete len:102 (+) Transcript_24988:41-346(+)
MQIPFNSLIKSHQSFRCCWFYLPVAAFSKYISKSRTKRLPLTTKRVGKGFKKGYGGQKAGFVSSKGRFVSVKEMHTELVVPDLTGFKLKPYIAPGVKRHVF